MAYNINPSYLKLSGGTMTGLLTLSGDPVGANDAATKSYVDAISAGLNFKTAVTCATTADLNATYLNGALGVGATLINAGALVAFTVDGITPTINQRVLVKNQTSTLQNGIYTITTLGTGAVAWILTRATDYDQAAEIKPGDIIPVSTGTTQANTSWLQTSTIATMGTDGITFQQYQSTPVQTTQYDVLVGGPSNTVVSVGPGSTGQFLQSGGNAANPAYSTATLPATATGTGKVLIADGTNWVASTPTYPNTSGTAGKVVISDGTNNVYSTPTFPNASATTRKIIVSDGTNWTASTETWAVPGTSGNLLTSNGTNWTSASPQTITITGTLTNSQIKNLHGTPIQAIAAQGVGTFVKVIEFSARLVYGGNNAFTNAGSQPITITYAQVATIGPLMPNSTLVATANQIVVFQTIATLGGASTNFDNVAITFYNSSATEIAGNAANDNTITWSLTYQIKTY